MMRKVLWVSVLLVCCSLVISCNTLDTCLFPREYVKEKVYKYTISKEPEYKKIDEERSSAWKEWGEVGDRLKELATSEGVNGGYKWTPKRPEDAKEVESLAKKYEEAEARYWEAWRKQEAYVKRRHKEIEEKRIKEKQRKAEERRRAKVQPLLNQDPEYQQLVKEISFAEVMISSVESKEERQKWEAKLEQLKSREEALVARKWGEYQEEKKRREAEGEDGNGGNGGGGY